MPTVLKDRIIFDAQDWVGGMTQHFTQQMSSSTFGTSTLRKLGSGYVFSQNFDPLHEIPGVAYPGLGQTKISNVDGNSPAGLLVDATTDLGQDNAYAIGGTELEQITAISTTPALTVTGGTFPHTITPHGHSTVDASLGSVKYYNVSGTNKLFYSWGDATDWDVGTYDFSTTFDDDFMSTVPTTPLAGSDLTDGTGKGHPLFISNQDDILYMGSARHVHAYNGATDTFTAQDFILPLNFDVKGFADTQFDMVIFADTAGNTGRTAQAKAFFWDESRPSSAYKIVPLDDNKVSAPFSFNGTVGCITENRAGDTVLRLYNGEFFEAVAFQPSGSSPSVGGVEIQDNMIIWNSGGLLYSYGSYRNQFPPALHQTSGRAGGSSGFVKSLSGSQILVSRGTGNDGLYKLVGFSATGTQSIVNTLYGYPTFNKGERGQISQIDINFATSVSGDQAVTINLKIDEGSTTVVTGITDTTIRKQTFTKDSSGGELPNFEGLGIQLSWDEQSGADTVAPGVESVVVWYEPIKDIEET